MCRPTLRAGAFGQASPSPAVLSGSAQQRGVVTTSSFSSQALEFVRHVSQRVILIDGQRLTDLMIEHNVGMRLSRAIEFKRLNEDFFAEDD
jgi:restriction system protein